VFFDSSGRVARKYGLVLFFLPTRRKAAGISTHHAQQDPEGAPGSVFEPGSWVDSFLGACGPDTERGCPSRRFYVRGF
jgi:hypothetical protein